MDNTSSTPSTPEPSTKTPGRMSVTEVDEAREKRKRVLLATGLASLATVVLGGGLFLAWYLTPPAMPTTAEEAMAVAKSPRFARLSDEDKRPYYDVFREQFGLNPELRRVWREDPDLRDASRDMFREMMNQRLDAFILADSLEEQQAAFGENPWGRRPRGEGRGDRPRPDASAMRDRVSDRLANGNPQHGAAMGEMIRQRRDARDRQN